jgi:hypothetical protein
VVEAQGSDSPGEVPGDEPGRSRREVDTRPRARLRAGVLEQPSVVEDAHAELVANLELQAVDRPAVLSLDVWT